MLIILVGLRMKEVAMRSSLEVGKYLILGPAIWNQTIPTIHLTSTTTRLLDLRL